MRLPKQSVQATQDARISTFDEDLWAVDRDFRALRNSPINGRLSAGNTPREEVLQTTWAEINNSPESLFRSHTEGLQFTITPDGKVSTHLDLDGSFITNGSDRLLVMFHGALDRNIYTLPRLEYKRSLGGFEGSILFLQDPTLYVHDQLGLGWYVGTETDDVHLMVRKLVWNIISALHPNQVVFAGSSGGGFASLAVSAHFPGSTALVFSPQTSIERYLMPHRTRFISSAFPNLKPTADTLETIQDRIDMGALYSAERLNKIYYVQNSGDISHMERHCVPFLESVSGISNDYAEDLLRVEYKFMGHGHQVPRPHRLREYIEKSFLRL